MATGNKQQVASSETQPIVGGGSEKERTGITRLFHGYRPAGKTLFGLTILAALIVVVGAGWFVAKDVFHVGDKVYAQAAGHKVYKKELDHLIGSSTVSQHDAAVVLADKYLAEAMAKKKGITVTNKDLTNAYGPDFNKLQSTNRYQYQIQVNKLYYQKLREDNDGAYKGDLIVAQFSRYISYGAPGSPLLAERQAVNPLIGNPSAIAADKAYAKTFIDNLYNQIKSGKMTFAQAEEAERNDSREGAQAYPTLSHSGQFDTSEAANIPRNSLIQTASVSGQIKKLKPGQMTSPIAVKVPNVISKSSVTNVDSYYLIVRMNTISGHPSGLSFSDYLAASKKELGYKIYV